MEEEIIVKAPNIKEGLQIASQKLSTPVKDLSYKIIQSPSKIPLMPKEYTLRVWVSPLLNVVLEKEKNLTTDEVLTKENPLKTTSSNRAVASEKPNHNPVIIKKNGIFIKLDPNIPYDVGMIKALLERKNVLNQIKVPVDDILSLERGVFHNIGSFTGDMTTMSELILQVSEDKLKAFIIMKPPKIVSGPTATFEDVVAFLEAQGIKDHIYFDHIKSLVEEDILGTPILVAEGTPPITPNEALYKKYYLPKMVFVNENRDKENYVNLKGHTSYYHSFKAGELVCERSEKSTFEKGIDVFGNPIEIGKADVPLIFLKAGKGIRMEKGGKEFYALVDGFVSEDKDSLVMTPFFTVNESIGYNTGNINVTGDVLIKGDVQAGFQVHSTGNVTIEGFVQNSSVTASGDLTVKQGIISGRINVKGSLMVYYIEISHAYVLGNILCQREISNSHIYCSGYVLVYGNKSHIVGGEMVVKKGIIARQIGTALKGINLFVGVDPVILEIQRQLKKEHQELLDKIHKETMELERSRKSITTKKLGVVEKTLLEYREILEKVDTQVGKVAIYLESHKQSGFVTVNGTMYSGVQITLNGLSLFISEKIAAKTLRVENNAWQIEAISTASLEASLLATYTQQSKNKG